MSEPDVVVVGAGNAALCSAISAGARGARVVVLERAPRRERGGNSWFSDGAMRFAHDGIDDVRRLIPGLTDDEAARIDLPPYPPHAFLADLQHAADGHADPELAETLARRSLDTMEWLRDHGIPFALLYDNQSVERDGRFHFWGGLSVKAEGKGVGLVERLIARAAEFDIEVWYEARVTALETDGSRWIVQVQGPDASELVSTAAVILACGSFEADRDERRRRLGPEWKDAVVRGTAHNTGDGLRMALEAGATPHGNWAGCHAIATDANAPRVGDFSKPGDIFKKHSYPLGIIVNADGLRFLDEGADFRNYTYARYGKEVLRQPGHIAFQIFDAQVRDQLREEYRRPEATKIEADTLEDLASRLGLAGSRLVDTVRTYNAAVQDGPYDPSRLDGKGTQGIDPPKSNWALRIEQPPFLAFPVTCGITFTFGGVKVNSRAEVIGQDDTPIPGLYAAGEMVGGIFHENYPGGAGLMSGATFGRIAGFQAAGPR